MSSVSAPQPYPSCSSSEVLLIELDACIPLSLISAVQGYLQMYPANQCDGDFVLSSPEDFNAIRFCRSITGSLTIASNSPNADVNALWDIETVAGLYHPFQFHHVRHRLAGYLLIENTTLITLAPFGHVSSVGRNGSLNVSGKGSFQLIVDCLFHFQHDLISH